MLELKSIKIHLGLSEETYAYTATVYFNGKKAVEVSNQGHGGPDMQHAVNGASVKDVDDWCKANLPQWKAFDDEMMDTCLETWCSEQVGESLIVKDMNRVLKTRPMFIVEGKKGLFELKFKGVKKYDSRMADIVRERHPTATILNELDTAKALELYKEHG